MTTSSEQTGDYVARVRHAPRPGRAASAQLVLTDHRHRPTVEQVEGWLRDLRHHGYEIVRTGAVEPRAATALRRCGFEVVQRLALLQLDAPFAGARPTGLLRALRTEVDLDTAAGIDLAAFGGAWNFDADAIDEACTATPAHRARFALAADGQAVAYAITGRAGRSGFLQRLAVDPQAQGQGHGAALVADSLRWLRRWRVQTVLVNTERSNAAALHLYQRAGFRLRDDELLVLERSL